MSWLDKIITKSLLLRRIDNFLSRPKHIHLCCLFEKLGLPVPRYFVGWSDLGGGNHGGSDWIIDSSKNIAGNHTNIGTFKVDSGITATVEPYNGTSYGTLEVHAKTISIVGIVTASGNGFGGGGGGGGGGGEQDGCGAGGGGGPGTAGGGNGAGGENGCVHPEDPPGYPTGGNGGAGGSGGGSYGGSGGGGGSYGGKFFAAGNGGGGVKGGYAVSQGQGDGTIDESLRKGSAGGAGGGGGGRGSVTTSGGGGGGAANRGAGWIKLYAAFLINIPGYVYAKGLDNSAGNGGDHSGTNLRNGGVGGNAAAGGSSNGGAGPNGGYGGEGGWGAGGGILLWCNSKYGIAVTGAIDNRGGNNGTVNGGTIKIFTLKDCQPSIGGMSYGRLYQNETLTKGILIS